MMTISVNGALRQIPRCDLRSVISELTGCTLSADGTSISGSRLGFAVAVNETVIPRGLWATHSLNNGDRVEILTAVQGG